MTDPFPRENWTVTPQWNKEEYVWNIGDPLGHFLVLPCPVIKIDGKLYQPNPKRTTSN